MKESGQEHAQQVKDSAQESAQDVGRRRPTGRSSPRADPRHAHRRPLRAGRLRTVARSGVPRGLRFAPRWRRLPAVTRARSTDRTAVRIIEASRRLLDQSPGTPVADLAAAAGVSRSTFYRHFPGRASLVEALGRQQAVAPLEYTERPLTTGQLGRRGPVPIEGIHVFDVVAPPVLPEQLVAEAQRIAEVPVALYVVDIDGSHLLRVAGPDRLPDEIEVPLAIGPELDATCLAELAPRARGSPGHRGRPALAAGSRLRA